MEVSFHNREDGTTVFRITRSDGSVTWQKQQGPHARFFPLHDLTHYAVETTLRTRSAFYVLIASGWDISDTDGKHDRGPLPPRALTIEHIVGLLDHERAGVAVPMTVDEFNEQLESSRRAGRLSEVLRLTEDQLSTIRSDIAALQREWLEHSSRHEPMVLRFSVPDGD